MYCNICINRPTFRANERSKTKNYFELKLALKTRFSLDWLHYDRSKRLPTLATHKAEGGLDHCTASEVSITYTPEYKAVNINLQKTELQTTQIHLNKFRHIYITNIYIPLRDTTRLDHPTENQDITNIFTHLTQLKNNIVTGDINPHSQNMALAIQRS